MTVATRRAWDGGIEVDFLPSGGAAEPVVVSPPATAAPSGAFITAVVVDAVTTVGTRKVPTIRTLSVPRDRYRVVMGDKDVTFDESGARTPLPSYALVSPLLYGSASLTLPGIHAALESAGVDKFVTVQVQRVDSADNVVATDYIGFVSDDSPNGREWASTLGGQATGRAAMMDRQVPVFPDITDIGSQAMNTVQSHLRLPIAGGDPPKVGTKMAQTGGGSELDFLTELLAKSTERDGDQWTIMPNADGKYEMVQKDLSTVYATVYIDGFRVVESLRRDFTEEPNRVFASGYDSDGRRIWNAAFPGLAGPDEQPFPGTTLVPGDTGDSVTAVIGRLDVLDYFDQGDTPKVWTTDADDPVTAAVEEAQTDLGLSITGNVNEATWNALFDPDKSGYSLKRTSIRPMSQANYVDPYLYTASGARRGRNPNFNRSKPLVDVTVDLGRVDGTAQAKRWARRERADDNAKNWVGTITVNTGAVIDGTHNPGDVLTSDLVRDVRSIKPGMNLWVPRWDDDTVGGGTLFHVSGVNVSASSVEFAVDTRARDTMKVWEVIARNRESRRSPSRQWIAQNRRSGQRDNSGAFYDGGKFGKINRTFCPAGTWTVIPTPAGRSGVLQTINLQATAGTEFAVSIWGKQRTSEWLDNHVGDWNTDSFWDHFNSHVDDWQDKFWLVDHWGQKGQPCGTGSASSVSPSGTATGVIVTGRFKFTAGAPYYCQGDPVLWIAIRPLIDTHIDGGRALELLLDDGAT